MSLTTQETQIEKFQCPGCIHGSSPATCTKYKLYSAREFFHCANHYAATSVLTGNGMETLNLGLPTGFSRIGPVDRTKLPTNIRIHDGSPKDEPTWFDTKNVPVWKAKIDGVLYVRTYLPRINVGYVDIFLKGELVDIEGALDVTEAIKEME